MRTVKSELRFSVGRYTEVQVANEVIKALQYSVSMISYLHYHAFDKIFRYMSRISKPTFQISKEKIQ